MKKILMVFSMAIALITITSNKALAQQIRVDDSGPRIHPCTGQTIDVTGYYTVQTNENNGNKKNSVLVVSGKYKGVGPDGTEYNITGFIHEISKVSTSNQTTVKFRNKQHYVSKGNGSTFTINWTSVLTIDANGDVKEFVEDKTTECK